MKYEVVGMIYYTSVKERSGDSVVDVHQNDVDYVDSNGDIHIHVKNCEVMVTAKSDLASLSGYEPSTIAYTAGFKNIWQLGADGNWVAIIEEDSEVPSEEPSEEDSVDEQGG